MKKTIIICALMIGVLSLTGCGSESASTEIQSSEAQTEAQTTENPDIYLKKAYDHLCNATNKMSTIGDAIQGAWHYGIYSDNGSYSELSVSCGIPASKLSAAAETRFGFNIELLLQDINYAVPVTIAALSDEYKLAKGDIEQAKDMIKQATDDLDNYGDMKNFYTSALAYYEWLESPTGNFQQATETRTDYENELTEYKNDLSFDYSN